MRESDLGWVVSGKELSKMRGNSKFWAEQFGRMDTECLIEQARYYLKNCSYREGVVSTYDDAMFNVVVPELLKRLSLMGKELFGESCNEVVDEVVVDGGGGL